MVNINGNIVDNAHQISLENRGYQFGDALFETLRVIRGNILFWEDHYFRLMASMRILRMEIPMFFTMEFLEQEVLRTIEANGLSESAVKVRVYIDRSEGGQYLLNKQKVNYLILTEKLVHGIYSISENNYTVDLFKDYFSAPGLLSTLNTNNKIIHVLGSIYALENELNDCLLLNTDKNVTQALSGNLFLVHGNTIKTPPLEDGCIKGIMRKQLIQLIKSTTDYDILEASISAFELQKADEMFITNVIQGIQSITHYRKKNYRNEVAKTLVQKLNDLRN